MLGRESPDPMKARSVAVFMPSLIRAFATLVKHSVFVRRKRHDENMHGARKRRVCSHRPSVGTTPAGVPFRSSLPSARPQWGPRQGFLSSREGESVSRRSPSLRSGPPEATAQILGRRTPGRVLKRRSVRHSAALQAQSTGPSSGPVLPRSPRSEPHSHFWLKPATT